MLTSSFLEKTLLHTSRERFLFVNKFSVFQFRRTVLKTNVDICSLLLLQKKIVVTCGKVRVYFYLVLFE